VHVLLKSGASPLIKSCNDELPAGVCCVCMNVCVVCACIHECVCVCVCVYK